MCLGESEDQTGANKPQTGNTESASAKLEGLETVSSKHVEARRIAAEYFFPGTGFRRRG
jgi:hypothetical protein